MDPRSQRFLSALASGPVLLDAAMGTRLISLGLDLRRDDPSLWALGRPDLVREIHRRDVAAGADALVTNTFGANRDWLSRFGREEEVAPINRRATDLAREAAGAGRFLLGDIGPTASDEAAQEQAEVLADSGVDALLLETCRGRVSETHRVRALRDATGLAVLYSMFEWLDPVAELTRALIDTGASAIGCNCRVGMAEMLRFAMTFGPGAGVVPLLVKPGAGLPGGPVEDPRSFAAAVPRLLGCGVRLLGGCCGATEDHVKALRDAIDTTDSA